MLPGLSVLTRSSLFTSLNEAETDTYAQQKQQDRKQQDRSSQWIKVQPAVGRISERQQWPSQCPKHSHTSYRMAKAKTM